MAQDTTRQEQLREKLKQIEHEELSRVYSGVEGWQLLLGLGDPVELKRGETLVLDYDGPEGIDCFVIVKGCLGAKIFRNGEYLIFHNLHRTGSLVYEANALLGISPNLIVLEALEDTQLERIPHEKLEQAAEADTRIYKILLDSSYSKFTKACNQIREITSMDATLRTYSLLTSLAAAVDTPIEDGWARIGIKMTQQSIADALGMNRVTVTKCLKELNELGYVIKRNGWYCVHDNIQIARYRN